MSDRLRHTTSSPSQRERYGTWDLAGDQPAQEGDLSPTELAEDRQQTAYEEHVRHLMRRQLRLSLAALTFLLVPIFTFVVAAHLYREPLSRPLWHGFSMAFLAGAVLIYPLTWVIAAAYTLLANRMDRLS